MNDYVSFAEYESLEFSSFEQTTSHADTTLKSAAELSTIEVPERQWAWQDWLPLGTASLLGGPPGAGKSLLAQTICMAASKGLVLYGADTRLMSTLYLTCEDDEGELIRRGQAIAAGFGSTLSTFHDCYLQSWVGLEDPAICGAGFRKTQSYKTLDEWMTECKLQLVFLDVIPDFWHGNEIIRQEVNRFVKGFLGSLAVKHNACIIGLHHPSVQGQTSGKGTSGSTAWEGSVRSRLYLKGADENGVRQLSLKKSNYSAPTGIDLKWDQGALRLSEQRYIDPSLKDGGRQPLKGVAKRLHEAICDTDGEMTHAEVKAVLPKSDQRRDAITALKKRGLVSESDGMLILTEL
jgi:RecA-family ATPase